MKKTLIAALLCAPMALASSVQELNSQIKSEITSTGYTAGDGYTLTLTLGATGASTNSFLKLADKMYIDGQVGKYFGIHHSGTNDTAGGLAWTVAPIVTTVSDITTTTVTLSSDIGTGKGVWVSYDKNGTSHGEKSLSGATLTLTQEGADTILTVAYAGDNVGLVNKVVWENTHFDANDFEFGAANAGTTLTSFTVTPATPEPATATLSLLALAGLASRRRRH